MKKKTHTQIALECKKKKKAKKKKILTDKSRQEYSCLGFTTQLFKFGVLEWDVTMLNEEGVCTVNKNS